MNPVGVAMKISGGGSIGDKIKCAPGKIKRGVGSGLSAGRNAVKFIRSFGSIS